MKKDTFYFSHDATAKDDPKCMLLIDQLGLEGYGIFWVLVETLRTQPDYKCPLLIIPSLARRFNTTAEKMMTVVRTYDLFLIENEVLFFSDSLNKRMAISDAKRAKLSEAGKLGYQVKTGAVEPPLSQAKATFKQLKEIKVNKSKLNSDLSISEFEVFRKEYPGQKPGSKTAFKEYTKHEDWSAQLPNLLPALKKEIEHKANLNTSGQFCPPWKNLTTWLNKRSWEQEFEAFKTPFTTSNRHSEELV